MTLGKASSFNILQQSPHDFQTPETAPPVSEPEADHWVPSRYNIRARTEDGRLVLWNSYTGSMVVFPAAQREAIESLLVKKGFEAPLEGVVEYLYDQGFLIRKNTDEFRRIQHKFGQTHYRTDTLELILLASEDCNFRCVYCYEDFDKGTMLPEVRQGVKNLVEQRLSQGLRNLTVSWFGGEPLYGWEAVEDLASYFHQMAEEHSLRFFSNMTTNGYLLTSERAEKLLRWGVNKYQITVDGVPEDHNCSRPTRDGRETFSTIFENLSALATRSDPFVVDIRVNFDRRNLPQLSSFLDMLKEEFAGDPRFRMRFRAVGTWGGKNDNELEVCGFRESTDIQMEMREEARRRGLNVSNDDDLRLTQGIDASSQVCYAARPYNFLIGATGKVMKCTVDLDRKDRNVLGRLTEEGEMELDPDKLALWTEPAFEQDTQCKKCVVLPVCQGIHCPLIRIEHGRSPCTPLRLNVKKELRALYQQSGSRARPVQLGEKSAVEEAAI